MKLLLLLPLLLLLAGCDTVRFGVSYRDSRGINYTVARSRNSERAVNWDILVTADGKEMRLPR